MARHQTSLIDGLAEDHLVRRWWEGRLGNEGASFSWLRKPNGADLNALRNGAGMDRMDRRLLVEVIEEQYADSGLPVPSRVGDLAQSSARTVTTGHQLCLGTGPAFTVYKALTAVRLANTLEARWGTPVVPVFWLASEDHDFEEICALWDGEDWHRWASDSAGGAVGRMNASGAADALSDWAGQAGIQDAVLSDMLSATKGSLSSAMRHWIHTAIGSDRIVVIDGDDARLKAAFAPQMEREIREGLLWKEVSKVNAVLQNQGHAPQVHVRETNLFYLGQGSRSRLIQNGEVWSAGAQLWDGTEALLDHLSLSPDSFSPNALLRPLYQAFLLPDVAVVGGLAEVAYWLQLSTAYEAMGLRAPALVPRDSARVTPAPWSAMASEAAVTHLDFGASLDSWETQWLARQEVPDVQSWRDALDTEAETAGIRFSVLDATLKASVEATKAKMVKLLDKLEGQGRRAIRRQHSEELGALARLHGWFYPEGKAQERVANFHVLSSEWTGEEGLGAALDRAFVEGHHGENWSPVLHDLIDDAT